MSLPLSKLQVVQGHAWLTANFGAKIAQAVAGKPYTASIVSAIACKETGFIWIGRSKTMRAGELLPLLIGDASGDLVGYPRGAFPKNTAEFRASYGDEFTNMLIAETNKARALREYQPLQIVYKGYGIFQYDLQHVKTDEVFFRNKSWYEIDQCLTALCKELDRCFAAASNDVHDAIRRYNGSGPDAEIYADHVMLFVRWCDGLD